MAHNQDQDKAQPWPKEERESAAEERESAYPLADLRLRIFSIYLF